MELNFKGLEMQKMKYTNRAENVDEKNGVICWVIMFTPRVIVIKMSKIAHFFADGSKKLVKNQAKYLSTTERSSWVLSENNMVNRLWSYHSWDIRYLSKHSGRGYAPPRQGNRSSTTMT